MKTYYTTDSDGKITQSAGWPFPGHTHETGREIIRGYDGGLYFAGDEPIDPNPPPPLELAAAIVKRDAMLAATDWYAVRASEPGGKPIPPEVLEYRAALRDIDQQTGWPSDVTWPELPASLAS